MGLLACLGVRVGLLGGAVPVLPSASANRPGTGVLTGSIACPAATACTDWPVRLAWVEMVMGASCIARVG